jgi:hypothetical protein
MNIVAKLFEKKKRKVVADCNCLMLFTNKHRALCFAFHLVAYKEKSIVWFIKLANKELLGPVTKLSNKILASKTATGFCLDLKIKA